MKTTHIAAFAAAFLATSDASFAKLPNPDTQLTNSPAEPTPIELACDRPGSRIYLRDAFYQSNDGKEVSVVKYERPDPQSPVIIITGASTYSCPTV